MGDFQETTSQPDQTNEIPSLTSLGMAKWLIMLLTIVIPSQRWLYRLTNNNNLTTMYIVLICGDVPLPCL
jgi:hypothetical protein